MNKHKLNNLTKLISLKTNFYNIRYFDCSPISNENPSVAENCFRTLSDSFPKHSNLLTVEESSESNFMPHHKLQKRCMSFIELKWNHLQAKVRVETLKKWKRKIKKENGNLNSIFFSSIQFCESFYVVGTEIMKAVRIIEKLEDNMKN